MSAEISKTGKVNSTSSSCSFKSKSNIGTNEGAIIHPNISGAAAHFTANDKTTMCCIHRTIAYDNIFCRHASFSSFCIASGFNTDAIIAYIKCAVLNQNIFAALKVNTVSILCIPRILYPYVPDSNVAAH